MKMSIISKEKGPGPGWAAPLVGALSGYSKAAGLLPSQSARKDRPMRAQLSGKTSDVSFSPINQQNKDQTFHLKTKAVRSAKRRHQFQISKVPEAKGSIIVIRPMFFLLSKNVSFRLKPKPHCSSAHPSFLNLFTIVFLT